MKNFYIYSPEYRAVSFYYGDKCAERSGVPLMAHIEEGCAMLTAWDRPLSTVRAFCIHPLVQAGDTGLIATSEAMPLAQEYARIADKYLCRPDTDRITNVNSPTVLKAYLGDMSKECAWMLLADKLQNQKDFRIYHWFSHNRRVELDKYFDLWIRTLKEQYL